MKNLAEALKKIRSEVFAFRLQANTVTKEEFMSYTSKILDMCDAALKEEKKAE